MVFGALHSYFFKAQDPNISPNKLWTWVYNFPPLSIGLEKKKVILFRKLPNTVKYYLGCSYGFRLRYKQIFFPTNKYFITSINTKDVRNQHCAVLEYLSQTFLQKILLNFSYQLSLFG